MKTTMVHARIEPKLKKEVESVLHHLGLTVTQAINLFYRQIKLRKGLPFQVKVPNSLTRKTFQKTDKGIDVASFKDKEALFKDLSLRPSRTVAADSGRRMNVKRNDPRN